MTATRMLAAPAPPARARATQGPLPLGHVDSPAERDADERARERNEERMPHWSFAETPLTHAGEPETLDVRVDDAGLPARALLPAAESAGPLAAALADAPHARIHTGPAAADTTRRAGVQALTAGPGILIAPGRFAPRTTEGARLLSHELRHVAQASAADRVVVRRDGKKAATAAPATTLTGLPEADRKRIQVTTGAQFSIPSLDTSFAANAVPEPLPADTTVAIDSSAKGVDAAGLRNVVAQLTTGTAPALLKNMTVTLELALAKHGGVDGLYRFTYHSPPVPDGGKAADRVLVEQLGTATAPAGQAVPDAPASGKPAKPDLVAAKIKTADISHSLEGEQLEALRGAVSLIPAAHLAMVKGLTITVGEPSGDAGEDGHYDMQSHTVTVRDSVFMAGEVRYTEKRRAVSYATQVILHEIGHAVDFAPFRTQEKAFTDAGAAEAAVRDKHAGATDKKAVAQGDAAIKAAEAKTKTARETLEKTKSRSGGAASVDEEGTASYDTTTGDAKGSAFRKAVEKDGIAVSEYGEDDWSESFAEAYSLYISSPEVLKSLRPATFAHLHAELNKQRKTP